MLFGKNENIFLKKFYQRIFFQASGNPVRNRKEESLQNIDSDIKFNYQSLP